MGKLGQFLIMYIITFDYSCKISVSMIIATIAISITSITFITLNRYLAIIWKTNITRSQALVMITLTWIIFSMMTLLYGLNDNLVEANVALQPSYGYCFLNFSATDPIVIVGLILVIVFMSIPPLFMMVAYSQIIIFYRKMNRRREYVTLEVFSGFYCELNIRSMKMKRNL